MWIITGVYSRYIFQKAITLFFAFLTRFHFKVIIIIIIERERDRKSGLHLLEIGRPLE